MILLISSPFSLETESFVWDKEENKVENNDVVNKKLERNTLPTRFLITPNVDDKGVRRDGDDDDTAIDVSDDDNSNDDSAAAVNTACDDAANDNPNADVAVGFDDDGDSAEDDADALAVDIASDDAVDDDPEADADADVATGFDDDSNSVDGDADTSAGNVAADDECDEDDSNGEGEIIDKGDCDIDCNKAECWRKLNCQNKIDTLVGRNEFWNKIFSISFFRILNTFFVKQKRLF